MATIINLTPAKDDTIVLRKVIRGVELEVSFPDRIPASLIPTIMGMYGSDGQMNLSVENLSQLIDILTQLILDANPDLSAVDAQRFLDLQDLIPIVNALINPSTPDSQETVTPTPMNRATRRKKNS